LRIFKPFERLFAMQKSRSFLGWEIRNPPSEIRNLCHSVSQTASRFLPHFPTLFRKLPFLPESAGGIGID
jgi:hypothetical protein